MSDFIQRLLRPKHICLMGIVCFAILDFVNLWIWSLRVTRKRGPSGIPFVSLIFCVLLELFSERPTIFDHEPTLLFKALDILLLTIYSSICNFPITIGLWMDALGRRRKFR